MLSGKPFSHFFYIRNGSGIIAPDASPVCTLIRNAIDTTIEVLPTATVDGGWVAVGAIPSNWAVGDFIHLRIVAQASGYPMSDTTFLGTIEPDNSALLNAIGATLQDLSDLRGFTDGVPMTANTDTGVIQAGSKRVVVTENGSTQTYTRDDV